MTEKVIPDRFLLETETAAELFHDYARDEPIIDYHNHLPPAEIAQDVNYRNMAHVWLGGDHYKWRAMRANGEDERLCTGDAPDREKFQAWARTVPALLRNPLYHWAHLELARYFGIDDRPLNPDTAESVWNACNEQLASPEFSARRLLERMNVAVIGTTDDPTDSLEHHRALAADDSFKVKVVPSFRPDKAMAVDDPGAFNGWVDRLAEVADIDINGFGSYVDALRKRHAFFHECGCRLSDHGLDKPYAEDYTETEVAAIFDKIRAGRTLDTPEADKFKSAMLYEFGLWDHERDWTQQYHMNALRNVNRRMFERLGPDAGFDSMNDFDLVRPLGRLLNRLAETDQLPRTILYSLNPKDNYPLASMLGNFQDGRTPGKMQLGSGWWFLDNIDGMTRQIEALSNTGLLSRFVGMLTDSRSFLSFPRHEYFRRLVCNILGGDIERGLIPRDMQLVGDMVRDICSRNAERHFRF